MGLQQTWQSSIRSCLSPSEGSGKKVVGAPQCGHGTSTASCKAASSRAGFTSLGPVQLRVHLEPHGVFGAPLTALLQPVEGETVIAQAVYRIPMKQSSSERAAGARMRSHGEQGEPA